VAKAARIRQEWVLFEASNSGETAQHRQRGDWGVRGALGAAKSMLDADTGASLLIPSARFRPLTINCATFGTESLATFGFAATTYAPPMELKTGSISLQI
jgi:hypothetical protein